MEMLKCSFYLLVLVVFASSKHHKLSADTLNKLLNGYEDYIERKEHKGNTKKELVDFDVLQDLEDLDKKETLEAAVDRDGNGNRDTCDAINVLCHYCTECHPGGWCVTGKNNKPYCLCKHGWTGPQAVYVTTQNQLLPPEGRNRVYANDCNTPCHYTHDFRGAQCATECLIFNCKQDDDKQCGECKNGKCDRTTGKCVCCRGWTGDGGVYDATKNAYVATVCDKVCPYLGEGIENVGCKPVKPIDDCDPKCLESEGTCIKETGKCQCCLGFTGPNAVFVNNRIHADYCNKYCPYTEETIDLKCANPNYVNRLPVTPTLLID